MLVREAKWYAARLAELGDVDLFPMLNVGSHTEDFRVRQQPYIDAYLFAPLRARGGRILHLDLQDAPGVDLIGDLTDPHFVNRLGAMRFRSAICSNLLEHVTQREAIGAAIVAAVEPGGFLFVSCPNAFPYHPDPIDTMYRPGIEELAFLFPGTSRHCAEVLACGSLIGYVANRLTRPWSLVASLFCEKGSIAAAEKSGPVAPPASPLRYVPWLFKSFRQTCLVLRKNSA